ALLVLMMFNMDLSVIAMIGIVMLVGIVKRNAIMMIDFAIERRRVGMGAQAAIREAALLRFRPIMMTTFAALSGTVPMATGTGAGGGAAPAARRRRGRRSSSVAAADAVHHAGRLYLSRSHGPHAQVPARAAVAGGAGARRAPDRGRSRVIATGGPAPSLPDGTALAFFPCHEHADRGVPHAPL